MRQTTARPHDRHCPEMSEGDRAGRRNSNFDIPSESILYRRVDKFCAPTLEVQIRQTTSNQFPNIRRSKRNGALRTSLLYLLTSYAVSACSCSELPKRMSSLRRHVGKDILFNKMSIPAILVFLVLCLQHGMLVDVSDAIMPNRHSQPVVQNKTDRLRNNTSEAGIPLLRKINEAQARFSVDNIDYNTTVSCGYHKCFFPLLDNRNEGYVVVQEGLKRLQSMRQAWELAIFIQNAFGAHQLVLEEPHFVNISAATAAKLNTNLYYDEDEEEVEDRFREGSLIVQKQKRAPSPSLIFGTTKWKKRLFFANIEMFMKKHVNDKKAFAEQLRREVDLSEDLVDKVRCLGYDFQVFVATDGTFYHFDLDRCFLHGKEDEDEVMDRFVRRTKELRSTVRKLMRQRSKERL